MFIIKKGISLKEYNTFGIDVSSTYYVEAGTIEKISFAANFAAYNEVPIMVLGGGSNTLFTGNYNGMVLRPTVRGIALAEDMPREVLLRVGAGVRWDALVEFCVSKGLYGLENLSGIPGDVGGAAVQNIGAYGAEVSERIAKVEGLNIALRTPLALSSEECAFGYRDSIFKRELRGSAIITHVCFKLSKSPDFRLDYGDLRARVEAQGEPTLVNVRQAVLDIRAEKLPNPQQLGNAGSFFKNPVVSAARHDELLAQYADMPSHTLADGTVKLHAAWLIDQCGWKGKRVGNCGVHANQALVLVNHGGATGSEIAQLANDIKQSVSERFAIELEPEVTLV